MSLFRSKIVKQSDTSNDYLLMKETNLLQIVDELKVQVSNTDSEWFSLTDLKVMRNINDNEAIALYGDLSFYGFVSERKINGVLHIALSNHAGGRIKAIRNREKILDHYIAEQKDQIEKMKKRLLNMQTQKDDSAKLVKILQNRNPSPVN
jgi:hypothetical protein